MNLEARPSCPHCGKDDFRSARGLQQHLIKNQKCNQMHQESISMLAQKAHEAEVQKTMEMLAAQGKRATRGQIAKYLDEHLSPNLPHDQETSPPALAAHANTDQPSDTDFDAALDDYSDDDVAYAGAQDHGSGDEANQNAQEDEDDAADADEVQPSSAGRDDFVRFCELNEFFAPLTRAEETGIKLMDVLRQKKAPINAYPSLMEWHLTEKGTIMEHQNLKDAGSDHYIGRRTLLNRLAQRYNLEEKGPVEKKVRLPGSREVVKIPVFDAEDKVVELLTNPRLEAEDFDFFNDDPLAPPPDDLDCIGNLNTGSGYAATHKELIKEANQQLLGCPFYIDGAVTGQFSDLPVTAVKFSLTIFTRTARMKDHMWAILGYIPEVKVAEGRGKNIFKESQHLEAEDMEIFDGEGEEVDLDGYNSEESQDGLTNVKAQDFHYMLMVILQSYRNLQAQGMIWDLMHKNTLHKDLMWHLYVPIVRSDTEEADALCGKYKTRTRNISQLCRQCEVPTLQASNHRANYPAKTQRRIEKLVRDGNMDRLQQMAQHNLKNAWYDIRFQLGNDSGIHGACPSEMLHQMQLGIFKYCRDIFFQSMGEQAQVALDVNGLARIYGKLLSHQSDRSLPSTNFSQGIRGGKLMAKDYRGVLLIMAVVLRSTQGRTLLGTKRNFKEEHKKDDWLLLVELLLEWEAYLCLPKMKKKHVKRLDKKHRYIMYIMKKVAKRSKGMGLNLMKFHAITHLMDDILTHGVPLEFDTAANESHHKESKLAARLTQRNESNFLGQVAIRLWEFHILDLALEEMRSGRRVSDYFDVYSDQSRSDMDLSPSDSNASDRESADGSTPKVSTKGAMIRVFRDKEGASGFEFRSKSKFQEKTQMSADLVDFLCGLQEAISEYLPEHILPIHTEHVRGASIFYGHPNFRGQGPWKDWAVVDWTGFGQLPCHIHCFVDIQNAPGGANSLEYGGIVLRDNVYAVVESASYENIEEEIRKSDLMVPILKDVQGIDEHGSVTGRVFYLADTEAFVRPCAVVPDIGGPPNRYFLVKQRSQWHKEFIVWVERPHNEDEMSDSDDDD